MEYKVVITSDAEEDLEGFIRYLLFEKRSEQTVTNLLNDFEVTKRSLSRTAGSLKLCDNPKLKLSDIEELISCHTGILCCIE